MSHISPFLTSILSLSEEVYTLLAVEVRVPEKGAAGAREGHHWQRNRDGDIYTNLPYVNFLDGIRSAVQHIRHLTENQPKAVVELLTQVSANNINISVSVPAGAWVNFRAVAPFVVNMAVPFPYGLELISSIASSSVSTFITQRTGPKISLM